MDAFLVLLPTTYELLLILEVFDESPHNYNSTSWPWLFICGADQMSWCSQHAQSANVFAGRCLIKL